MTHQKDASRRAVRAAERQLSREELALWRRITRNIEPLPGQEAAIKVLEAVLDAANIRHEPGIPGRLPVKVDAKKPRQSPAAPPADRSGEKRVRRGRVVVGGRLDLHGYTQDGAFLALVDFIEAAQARGARTVLVITGKGKLGEGVLRRRLGDWLAHPACRPHVAGFAEAHARHGGAGAFYVFLKPRLEAGSPFP